MASRKHEINSPKEGFAEQDAEKLWWPEICSICRELTSINDEIAEQIVSIGISSLSPALLPVDENGHALYPAMLYGLDRRAKEEIEELREVTLAKGEKIGPLSIGPKILWLKRNEPDIFYKARYFIGAPSFIVYRLTNQMVADYACYDIAGMPFSLNEFCWDEELCEACGITSDQLPKLKYGSELGGYVSEEAAKETGLKIGTSVSVGTGDFPAECCSYGTIYSSTIRITLGTTVGVNFGYNSSDPLFKDFDFKHRKKVKRGGSLSNGCSTIDWVINLISGMDKQKRIPDEELLAMVNSIKPGSDGVMMLPYLNGGSGPPLNYPEAKGMIFGLQMRHTQSEIYRASLESLAYSIRQILLPAPNDAHEAVILGGGTNIPGLLQIISDVTGFDLIKLELVNGSLAGDAFLAGMACGIFNSLSDIDPWIKTGDIIHANLNNKEIYDREYKKFIKLFESTKQLMPSIE